MKKRKTKSVKPHTLKCWGLRNKSGVLYPLVQWNKKDVIAHWGEDWDRIYESGYRAIRVEIRPLPKTKRKKP